MFRGPCFACRAPGPRGPQTPNPRGPVGTEGIPAKAEVQRRDGRSKFPWSVKACPYRIYRIERFYPQRTYVSMYQVNMYDR